MELARSIAGNPQMSVIQAKLALNASEETPACSRAAVRGRIGGRVPAIGRWREKVERYR
jgi:hypothetical protein